MHTIPRTRRVAHLLAIGEEMHRARQKLRPYELHPERDVAPGWATAKPSEYWRAVLTCCGELAEIIGSHPDDTRLPELLPPKLILEATARARTGLVAAGEAIVEWARRIEAARAPVVEVADNVVPLPGLNRTRG